MDQESDSRLISCSLCCLSGLKINVKICDYIKHLRLLHAHQTNFNFTCGIDGCLRSFTNIGTFKNHVSAMHYNVFPVSNAPTEALPDSSESYIADTSIVELGTSTSIDDDIEENMVIEKDVCVAPEDFSLSMLQKSSALFLLGLKEKHKLTQVAIQEIVENVASLTQQRLSFLKHQVIVVYVCTYSQLQRSGEHLCRD